MKNSCPQKYSIRVLSTYEANTLSIALLDLMHVHIEHLKVERFFPELRGTQANIYLQNENFLHTVGFKLGTLHL